MDQLPIILIAIAVAAIVWACAFAVTNLSNSSKRKLKQRLVAEDRFEGPTAAQSVRLLEQEDVLAGRFGRFALLHVLGRRVSQVFPSLSLSKFITISLLLAGTAGGAVWLAMENATAAGAAAVIAGYLPYLLVAQKRARWKKSVTLQIPEALDFLCRILRAGQSMSTGLQMIAEELGQPLGSEFRRCYEQHGLGHPLEDCLRDMALRIESQDFSFFVTAVIIQHQSGGDMAEILNNISTMIRQRLRLQQGIKAKTAEGRLTGYIMVAFPVVMFVISYVLNPERGNVLLHTSQGHMLLGVAGGLQLFGLFLIKRITTVRV